LKTRLTTGAFIQREFNPYYEGFKGTISKIEDNKYMIKGVYEKVGEDRIRITELPVGTWTMPYITFLEGLMDGTTDKAGKKIPPTIKEFTSVCTEVNVDITIVFPKGKMLEYEQMTESNGVNGLEKMLKLTTTITSTNMHMFNNDIKLNKYGSVEEIIQEFYGIRHLTYHRRRDYLIADLRRLLVKLSNRAKYILATLSGAVDLRRKTASQVAELLEAGGYDKIEDDYKYLTKMPMDSVTNENVESILKEKADVEREIEVLLGTTVEQMWLKELDILDSEYDKYKLYRERLQTADDKKEKKSSVKKIKK
jgi:DNA topoisomerase-2